MKTRSQAKSKSFEALSQTLGFAGQDGLDSSTGGLVHKRCGHHCGCPPLPQGFAKGTSFRASDAYLFHQSRRKGP
jgi:hypothetical protein